MIYSNAELQALDADLDAGASLLVPNFPASRQIQDSIAHWRVCQGAPAVQASSAVRPVDLWLSDLWQQLAMKYDDPRLALSILGPEQELLLWRRTIVSGNNDALLNPDGTAKEAREAWRQALQWQLPDTFIRPLRGEMEEHTAADCFGGWAWQFRATCQSIGAMSFSQMLGHMLALSREHPDWLQACLPKRLLLWGFDDPPPLYRALLQAFEQLGCELQAWACASHAPVEEKQAFQQATDELRAAAQWASAVLRAHPDARIGIICSNLRQLLPTAEQILGQEFDEFPTGTWLGAVSQPLSTAPFIHTALQSLSLFRAHWDTLELCSLLRSPWLVASRDEMEARADLEFALRRFGEANTELTRFCEVCASNGSSPLLGSIVTRARSRLLRMPRQQSFGAWLDFFNDCWGSLLDEQALLLSGQAALLNAWYSMREKLQQLEWLLPECTLPQAVGIVSTVAASQSLPQRAHSAPVMLLSPVATAGLRFTHLWCLQMDERHWPGETSASPFLPLALQRAHQMPGSDPALTLAAARNLQQQLFDNTSGHIVWSWSLVEDDCELRASPLLPEGPKQVAASPAVPSGLHPRVIEIRPEPCELLQESIHLPFPLGTRPKGDTSLLHHQAACPFRAFALFRLGAARLETPRFGLPAHAVGSCIHRMMEQFWTVFDSSEALAAATEQRILDCARDCARQALQRTIRDFPVTMSPRYRKLEEDRLAGLLIAWLPEEYKRGPFTVLENEKTCQWRFGSLELSVRIDRIDLDAQGALVIVDYKSGSIPKIRWDEDRQDQPQLMLYMQALEQGGEARPAGALLHAAINAEKCGYSGIGISDHIHPGIGFDTAYQLEFAHWQDLKSHWREGMQNLAQEYLDGNVAVSPLRNSSCDHCHLEGLCRIGERPNLVPGDDTDQADA